MRKPPIAKTPPRKEDELQQSCIMWFGLQWSKYRRLIHHSPNEEAHRHGAQQRALGMQVGFPDIFLAVARGEYHGLFIEMKTKTGKVADTQKDMLFRLSEQGYKVAICRSLEAFIKVVNEYLNQ